MRTKILLFLLLTFAGLVQGQQPNIILIFADDLGYADVGCYGSTDIRTPNIDRLAKQGTKFTSFYVAQPVCTASRAALFTGSYPNRVGMAGALNHLSKTGLHTGERLLSELIHDQGYATAAFGKWHLGNQNPFWPTSRGFDQFFGIPYSNDNGPLHPVPKGIPALPLYDREKIIELDPDQSQFTRRITEHSVDFIRQNKNKPFFLYIPHVMPHVPIFASDKFKGKSRRGLYGDVVEELDWSVGEIAKVVSELGIAKKTLILFASDNGPFLSYGEHAGSANPFREGKLTTFEGGVRVPFIASWPGKIPKGKVSSEMITSMDLYVILSKMAGAKIPEYRIDGQDLTPVVMGVSGAKGRDVFWYYSGNELHAVRKGKWKLHVPHEYLTVAAEPGNNGKPSNWANMKPLSHEVSGIKGIASRHGYRVENIELSLFDLEKDPGESVNLAAKNPAVVKELMQVVAEAKADLGDALTSTPAKNARPPGTL